MKKLFAFALVLFGVVAAKAATVAAAAASTGCCPLCK